jgi:hypothetical protein
MWGMRSLNSERTSPEFTIPLTVSILPGTPSLTCHHLSYTIKDGMME